VRQKTGAKEGTRSSRGFTLVEMLVVVAVVVVLLAILLPSLGYAKRRAQTAACLSNLRQLEVGFTEYLVHNNGKSFAMLYTSTGYWIPQLAEYDSKLGYTLLPNGQLDKNSSNQNMMCPAASTLANDVGSAASGWGTAVTSGKVYNNAYSSGNPINPTTTYPNTSVGFWSFLNAPYADGNGSQNAYAGGYGFNGWLYNGSGIPTGGAMAGSISLHGNGPMNANVVTVTDTSGHLVNGNVVAGGTASAGGTGTRQSNVPGIELPPVPQIYSELAKSAVVVNGATTLDFTQGPVLLYNGSPDLSNVTVIGTGTLLVNGSINGLPTGGQQVNLVVNGDVTDSGNHGHANFTGALYLTGNFTSNGAPATVNINGILVVMGSITMNGNSTYNIGGNGALPTWGGFGYIPNIMTTSNVMAFADAIWPEGTPSLGDPIPANPNVGDVTSQLGRFYINRHGSSINAVFTDGHAENAPQNKLPSWQWNY
jgi:prepilin-type N-terminal cleavage/methylation domain-containing protein/prepilin-type processing-associated H-X9-DG protein